MRIPWIRRHPGASAFQYPQGGGRGHDTPDSAGHDGDVAVLEAIGDEVEAYLAGDLAEYRVISAQEVAPWMLLNRLAHGSRVLLDQVVAEGRGWWRAEMGRGWQADEQYLAQRLVDSLPMAAQLRSVQLTVLVPLELRLAQDDKPRSPHEVMQLAGATIEAYLADHRQR